MNEKTKLYLKVLRNMNTNDLTAFGLKQIFALKIIDKKTEILNFHCMHIDDYTEKRIEDIIFFKGDRYRLTFLYNNVEMCLFKESSVSFNVFKLETVDMINGHRIKKDLNFLKDFFYDSLEYSKEDLLEIKNALISCMDDIVDQYNAEKIKIEAKRKRNETTKNNLNDFLKELD